MIGEPVFVLWVIVSYGFFFFLFKFSLVPFLFMYNT